MFIGFISSDLFLRMPFVCHNIVSELTFKSFVSASSANVFSTEIISMYMCGNIYDLDVFARYLYERLIIFYFVCIIWNTIV